MSSSDVGYVGCFGLVCAVIAFISTWFSMIIGFPFLGFIFGWFPAVIMALIVYVCAEIAFWLMLLIVVCLLVFAGILFTTGAVFLS